MVTVTMVDEGLRPRGQLHVQKVQVVMRKNQPHTFAVDVAPASLNAARRVGEGWWLIIRDGDLELSGPVTGCHRTTKNGAAELEISGSSALCLVGDRLTYPDPAHDETHQQAARYQRRGPGETVIKELVNLNTGAGAIPARRVDTLDVAPDKARGGQVSVDTRLKNLLEVATGLADEAGLLMMCSLTGRRITFDVRPVRDLSRRVRLSHVTGETTGWEMTSRAGTATAVVVGGQGEGADRTLTSVTATDGYRRRIEVFKDRRDTDDAAALEKSAREELQKGAPERTLKLTLAESPTRRFGEDFTVGDTITLDLEPGVTPYAAPVVEAKITWEAAAREVELTVGGLDKTPADARVERLRRELSQIITI